MQPELQYPSQAQSGKLSIVRNKVLRNTFWMLGLTMIPTIIGAMIGMSTNFSFMAQSPVMGMVVMLAVMFGFIFAIKATRNSIWGIVLLFGFTFCLGWFLGPLLNSALEFSNGPQLIGLAAGGTATILFSLAGYATVTKKDFGFMGNFLFAGMILLIIAMVANIFLDIPAASLGISAVAVLLFSGFILYDVSRIVNGGETNYVMAALGMYLNVFNLFVHLLHLLMAFAGQRD